MSVQPIRLLSVAASLAVSLAASSPAHALRARDTSAGGACHPANGAAAGKFTYGNLSLTNVGTVDQYVICHLQMDDDTTALYPARPDTLSVAVTAGATPGTVACVAQIGFHANGANYVRSSFSRSVTLAAGNNGWAYWDSTTAWTREFAYETLTLNCKVPPGFRMGLVEWLQ
jgi:hypothetical protein